MTDRDRKIIDSWAAVEADPVRRALKPIDSRRPLGYLQIDDMTRRAEGLEITVGDVITSVVWESGSRYAIVQDADISEWCLHGLGRGFLPPHCVGVLVTSPALCNNDGPAPPVKAGVCGRDGVGILLDSDAAPVRWVPLDGHGCNIDDQDHAGQCRARESGPATRRDWDASDAGGIS